MSCHSSHTSRGNRYTSPTIATTINIAPHHHSRPAETLRRRTSSDYNTNKNKATRTATPVRVASIQAEDSNRASNSIDNRTCSYSPGTDMLPTTHQQQQRPAPEPIPAATTGTMSPNASDDAQRWAAMMAAVTGGAGAIEIDDDDLTFGGKPLSKWYEEDRRRLSLGDDDSDPDAQRLAAQQNLYFGQDAYREEEEKRGRQRVSFAAEFPGQCREGGVANLEMG